MNRGTSSIVEIENLTAQTRRNGDLLNFYEAGGENNYKSRLIRMINKSLDTKDRHSFAITGGHGIGKSSLAFKVAHSYITSDKFDIVWWIDSEILSKRTTVPGLNISPDLKDLALKLGISTGDNNPLDRLREELSKRNYLLIFDNASDRGNSEGEEISPHEFEQNYSMGPDKRKNQRIVFTSINNGWNGDIVLQPWTRAEVQHYLQQSVKNHDILQKVNEIDNLYDRLGGLPLVVVLFASHLRNQSYDYASKFLEEFTQKTLIRITTPEYRHGDGALYDVFEITYDSLSDNAKRLLNMIALLAPDELPLFDLFSTTFGNNTKNLVEKELEKFTLVTKRDGNFYSIHRSYQSVVLTLLSERETGPETYAETYAVLTKAFKDSGKAKSLVYKQLLPHIESFVTHYIENDAGFDKAVDQGNIIKFARIAAKYSADIGYIALSVRLYDLITNRIAPHDETLRHEISLDNSHNFILADRNTAALKMAEDAFTYFSGTYRGNDQQLKREIARQSIGKVHQRKGDYALAKTCFETCKTEVEKDADIMKQRYSPVLHDLGSVWWEEGLQYDTALDYFEDAITYSEELKGKVPDSLEKVDLDKLGTYKGIFYSKLILGVVQGLEGDFDKERETHEETLRYFQLVIEQRRGFYVAYYLLHFAWDSQLVYQNTTPAVIKEHLDNYLKWHEESTVALEGDIKSAIIQEIVGLRLAVLLEDNGDEAASRYNRLIRLLEKKKNGERYLDDGTVSVSAVLDYAQYLKKKVNDQGLVDLSGQAADVAQMARAMLVAYNDDGNIQRIGYHRTAEVDAL